MAEHWTVGMHLTDDSKVVLETLGAEDGHNFQVLTIGEPLRGVQLFVTPMFLDELRKVLADG